MDVTGGAKGSHASKVKIDASKHPKQINMIFNTAGRKVVSPGIYKLDDDTLTLCRTWRQRPKEFKTTEAGGILIVWKRMKN